MRGAEAAREPDAWSAIRLTLIVAAIARADESVFSAQRWLGPRLAANDIEIIFGTAAIITMTMRDADRIRIAACAASVRRPAQRSLPPPLTAPDVVGMNG